MNIERATELAGQALAALDYHELQWQLIDANTMTLLPGITIEDDDCFAGAFAALYSDADLPMQLQLAQERLGALRADAKPELVQRAHAVLVLVDEALTELARSPRRLHLVM